MSGAGRVFNEARQKVVAGTVLEGAFHPDPRKRHEAKKKHTNQIVDDVGATFGPSQEQLDMMEKQETLMEQQSKQIQQQMDRANEPPPPMPDQEELRRAKRRRGQRYGGYSDTVLTDRLGG